MTSHKKMIKISILLSVIFLSAFQNYNIIQGRENPERDSPDLNNPVVLIYPSDFYIWEDRLYFKKEYTVYQYNIADRNNIVYMNHIQLDHSWNSYIGFIENKLITIDTNYRIRKEETKCTINTYNLNNNEKFDLISTKDITIPFGIEYAKILSDNLILLEHDYRYVRTDYDSYYLLSINNAGLFEIYDGISNENSIMIGPVEIVDNFLYIFTGSYSSESANLFALDISDITQPILLSNSTKDQGSNFGAYSKRINDLIYIYSYNEILNAINITNRSQPLILEPFTTPSSYAPIIGVNEHFAVAYCTITIDFYNISSFDNITLASYYSYTFDSYSDYQYAIQDIIILGGYTSFRLIDFSNISNVIYLGEVEIPYFKKVGFNQIWFIPPILLLAFIIRKRKK